MQHLEVSGAVRHIYIYIYIYVIRRLKVNIPAVSSYTQTFPFFCQTTLFFPKRNYVISFLTSKFHFHGPWQAWREVISVSLRF